MQNEHLLPSSDSESDVDADVDSDHASVDHQDDHPDRLPLPTALNPGEFRYFLQHGLADTLRAHELAEILGSNASSDMDVDVDDQDLDDDTDDVENHDHGKKEDKTDDMDDVHEDEDDDNNVDDDDEVDYGDRKGVEKVRTTNTNDATTANVINAVHAANAQNAIRTLRPDDEDCEDRDDCDCDHGGHARGSPSHGYSSNGRVGSHLDSDLDSDLTPLSELSDVSDCSLSEQDHTAFVTQNRSDDTPKSSSLDTPNKSNRSSQDQKSRICKSSDGGNQDVSNNDRGSQSDEEEKEEEENDDDMDGESSDRDKSPNGGGCSDHRRNHVHRSQHGPFRLPLPSFVVPSPSFVDPSPSFVDPSPSFVDPSRAAETSSDHRSDRPSDLRFAATGIVVESDQDVQALVNDLHRHGNVAANSVRQSVERTSMDLADQTKSTDSSQRRSGRGRRPELGSTISPSMATTPHPPTLVISETDEKGAVETVEITAQTLDDLFGTKYDSDDEDHDSNTDAAMHSNSNSNPSTGTSMNSSTNKDKHVHPDHQSHYGQQEKSGKRCTDAKISRTSTHENGCRNTDGANTVHRNTDKSRKRKRKTRHQDTARDNQDSSMDSMDSPSDRELDHGTPFNIIRAMSQYPTIILRFGCVMPPQTLVLLYSISRDFKAVVDTHMQSNIYYWLAYKAPGSAAHFPWRMYAHLTTDDPFRRTNEFGQQFFPFRSPSPGDAVSKANGSGTTGQAKVQETGESGEHEPGEHERETNELGAVGIRQNVSGTNGEGSDRHGPHENELNQNQNEVGLPRERTNTGSTKDSRQEATSLARSNRAQEGRRNALLDRIRQVPSLKYYQMVAHRHRYVRQILAILASHGHRCPPTTLSTLQKLWLTMNCPTSSGRRALLRNESYWTDTDLYNVQLFLVKLSMYFQHPWYGPNTNYLVQVLMGQRAGLYTTWQVLRHRKYCTEFGIHQLILRYDVTLPPAQVLRQRHLEAAHGQRLYNVPVAEMGLHHLEGWGLGREHLSRIDELLPLECAIRQLDLPRHLEAMVLWGYFDWSTGRASVPTEEELDFGYGYTHDAEDEEEAVLADLDTTLLFRRRHALKERWEELTPEQKEEIRMEERLEEMEMVKLARAVQWDELDILRRIFVAVDSEEKKKKSTFAWEDGSDADDEGDALFSSSRPRNRVGGRRGRRVRDDLTMSFERMAHEPDLDDQLRDMTEIEGRLYDDHDPHPVDETEHSAELMEFANSSDESEESEGTTSSGSGSRGICKNCGYSHAVAIRDSSSMESDSSPRELVGFGPLPGESPRSRGEYGSEKEDEDIDLSEMNDDSEDSSDVDTDGVMSSDADTSEASNTMASDKKACGESDQSNSSSRNGDAKASGQSSSDGAMDSDHSMRSLDANTTSSPTIHRNRLCWKTACPKVRPNVKHKPGPSSGPGSGSKSCPGRNLGQAAHGPRPSSSSSSSSSSEEHGDHPSNRPPRHHPPTGNLSSTKTPGDYFVRRRIQRLVQRYLTRLREHHRSRVEQGLPPISPEEEALRERVRRSQQTPFGLDLVTLPILSHTNADVFEKENLDWDMKRQWTVPYIRKADRPAKLAELARMEAQQQALEPFIARARSILDAQAEAEAQITGSSKAKTAAIQTPTESRQNVDRHNIKIQNTDPQNTDRPRDIHQNTDRPHDILYEPLIMTNVDEFRRQQTFADDYVDGDEVLCMMADWVDDDENSDIDPDFDWTPYYHAPTPAALLGGILAANAAFGQGAPGEEDPHTSDFDDPDEMDWTD